jgi:hypothetical protein
MRWGLLAFLVAGVARGDDLAEARAEYLRGTSLVEKLEWAEALGAFERSAQLRPHAVTTYNVGVCQRALGQYTRARATLERALDEKLPASLEEEARGLSAEIDRLLAHVTVTLSPAEAAIAVDGHPLQVITRDGRTLLIAGSLPHGPGAPAPSASFEMIANPGLHVITLSRKGYNDVVVQRSLAPGSTSELRLELEKLPATLHVTANQPGAIVAVDEVDIGAAPVDVQRPAGSHRVVVKKPGFVPYRTEVQVNAGEEANLSAALSKEKLQIAKKWWFWTALVAVVGAGAVLTWALTRPPPPYDQGNTGWLAMPNGAR